LAKNVQGFNYPLKFFIYSEKPFNASLERRRAEMPALRLDYS